MPSPTFDFQFVKLLAAMPYAIVALILCGIAYTKLWLYRQ
jgi:hypothetical protein